MPEHSAVDGRPSKSSAVVCDVESLATGTVWGHVHWQDISTVPPNLVIPTYISLAVCTANTSGLGLIALEDLQLMRISFTPECVVPLSF
jgi:hypothetical protein